MRRETFEAADHRPDARPVRAALVRWPAGVREAAADLLPRRRSRPGASPRAARSPRNTGPSSAQIEGRFGVPGEICLAAWGMESDFGRARGGHDIVRTLATLGLSCAPTGPPFATSSYRRWSSSIAVTGRAAKTSSAPGRARWAIRSSCPRPISNTRSRPRGGDAAPDIWTNTPDVLASIASFFRGSGWAPSQPWIEDVVLPELASPSRPCTRRRPNGRGSACAGGDGREPAGRRRGGAVPACGRSRPGLPAVCELLRHQTIQQFGFLRPVARLAGAADRRVRRRCRRPGRPSRSPCRARTRRSSRGASPRSAFTRARRTASSAPRPATRSTPIRSRPACIPPTASPRRRWWRD